MKRKKYIFSVVIISLINMISYGQDYNVIQLRFGIHKHIASNLPKELRNSWMSSSNQFDLILDRRLRINENYTLNGGLGISIFRFTNAKLFFSNIPQSNYGVFKYGVSRNVLDGKLSMNIDFFHYVLLHKEKQIVIQRRAFTNIEAGISYKIKDNFSLSLSSPLTLYPMFLIMTRTVENDIITHYSGKVLNYGINAGIQYAF